MDELPPLDEAVAAYDQLIARATAEGVPMLAAAAGLLLGVLLERSRHPGTGERVGRALEVLDRAAELDRPLRLARAFAPDG